MSRPPYHLTLTTATHPLRPFLSHYRDTTRIHAQCRACPHHGATWACPPLDPRAADPIPATYTRIRLIIARYTPSRPCIPLAAYTRAIAPAARRLQARLRRRESRAGGLLLLPIGPCDICAPQSCTRPQGHPCRHPRALRPTLQACGIDITAALAREHHITLRRSRRGHAPATLRHIYALLLP